MAEQHADDLDRYVDELLAGGRPVPDRVASDDAAAARMAAELTAGSDPAAATPDPAFVDQLRLRMRQADEGIATVRDTGPGRAATLGRLRISRRDLLRGGLGAAAGLAAGALGISVLRRGAPPLFGDSDRPLVGDGEWVTVASVADLPPGAVQRFSTAAFDGFLVNHAGEVRALSSVCTHMGCTLAYRADYADLRCPCHGASFDLQGTLANGADRWTSSGAYGSDSAAYPLQLPPLARPLVQVSGDAIQVWSIRS
jgi:nitrite reductase/ring-hydroxylating ferredoxin subunit